MFELKATDLAGRIGLLTTKSGTIETPALLPVIHPSKQEIPPSLIKEIGFNAVITNAYLAFKNKGEEARNNGIHKTIEFDGIIMTDSGGYQVLEYGDINVNVKSIALFQEKILSDIAVILDKPTGAQLDRDYAERSVELTLKAAKETLAVVTNKEILWTGPIQGGVHLDLIERSAKETSNLNFDIHALGSPTEIMQSYDFKKLTDMIITAKKHTPSNKPMHLFGAGHPLTIPLAVALGCDLFDSASYILYGREGRYLTDYGTKKLKDMSYLNCVCPICCSLSLKEFISLEKETRSFQLGVHNLYVLIKTVNDCKEAIREGRLWEYIGIKAKAHPRLWEAYKNFSENIEFLEDGVPIFKSKGLFLSDIVDNSRPEVLRHKMKMKNNIRFRKCKLLLLPETMVKPFYKSRIYSNLKKELGSIIDQIQICFLAHPFGIIPIELSDIYPLSQYEKALKPDSDSNLDQDMVDDIVSIIYKNKISEVFIWIEGGYTQRLGEAVSKKIEINIVSSIEELRNKL